MSQSTNSGQKARKAKEYAMGKSFLYTIWATILMVVFLFIAACSDYEGTEWTPPPVGGECTFPAICGSSVATSVPDFCGQELCCWLSVDQGDAVEPYWDKQCFQLENGSGGAGSSSDLTAAVTFKPLPNTTGQVLHAWLDCPFNLPAGYELQGESGKALEHMVEIKPLPAGETQHVIKLRIADAGSGGTPGNGLGDLCVPVTDSDGTPIADEASECEEFEVGGNPVTPADPNEYEAEYEKCTEGVVFKDLQVNTSTVVLARCGGKTGTATTGIMEGVITTVPITLEDNTTTPGDEGDVCGHTQKTTSQGLEDVTDPCDFNYLQLAASDEPVESTSPPSECAGDADHYWEDVPANLYDVAVACGGLSGQFKVSVLAGELSKVYFTLQESIVDDAPCVIKHGLPLDWYYTMADMEMYLGRGENGSCKKLEDVSGLTVTGWTSLTGPACVDSSCPIEVTDLVVTMGTGGWDDYAPMEQRVFEVTLTDGVDTWYVYIDSVNGYAFEPPQNFCGGDEQGVAYKVYTGWYRGNNYVPYMLFPVAVPAS